MKNIRRGNTILSIKDNDGKKRLSHGRKGLEKFFDMRWEFISKEDRYNDSVIVNPIHHMEKNYILAEPLREILKGHEVEILKTLKANGENVQISWSEAVHAWVICSKNVGLVAETIEDVDYYTADRYTFAAEMAVVWFDTLKKLEKKGHNL